MTQNVKREETEIKDREKRRTRACGEWISLHPKGDSERTKDNENFLE